MSRGRFVTHPLHDNTHPQADTTGHRSQGESSDAWFRWWLGTGGGCCEPWPTAQPQDGATPPAVLGEWTEVRSDPVHDEVLESYTDLLQKIDVFQTVLSSEHFTPSFFFFIILFFSGFIKECESAVLNTFSSVR